MAYSRRSVATLNARLRVLDTRSSTLGGADISAVRASAPARSAAASAASAPPAEPSRSAALTSTPGRHLEELLAAQRVERHAVIPGDRRKRAG